MAEDNEGKSPPEVEVQLQPGHVIAPGSSDQPPAVPQITPLGLPRSVDQRVVGSLTQDVPPPPKPAETPPPPPAEPEAEPAPRPEQPPAPQPPAPPAPPLYTEPAVDQDDGGLGWQAPEFVAHEKSPAWYLKLAGAAILLAVITYYVTPTRDVIASSAVLVGALFFGIYAGRHPRLVSFRVNDSGVGIGNRFHEYGEFRSFIQVPEGNMASIVFMPLKRFAPPMTIYFDPAHEDDVVSMVSSKLPIEEHAPDPIDRFMRHIRF